MDEHNDPNAWPPGTVRIETMLSNNKDDIILQPPPSDDPNDPLNWPSWRKHWNFAMVSFYSLLVFAFIDVYTPTWSAMHEELGFSYEILNDSYAIGCATLAIGAFMLIPFALKFGRRPVYLFSTVVQFAITIWYAKLQTVADLLLVNALSCLVAALDEVIVQMTVADVYFVHQRGMMNTIYVWVMTTGAYLSAVAGGYITESQGWRWVWWWMVIFWAVCIVLFTFTYEETKYTYPTVIQGMSPAKAQDPLTATQSTPVDEKEMKTEATGSSTPKSDSKDEEVAVRTQSITEIHINPNIPRKTYWQTLKPWTISPGKWTSFLRHSWQPIAILFTIPAVFYMSLVYGVMLAWQCVMITTLSAYMPEAPYNFNASQIGLMSIPPFIGTTLGSLICGPMSDWIILYLSRKNKGIFEPEMRLWVMVPFILFVPAGAFMFGIGLDRGDSWPVLAVGYAMCQFGTGPISSIALTYITDCYTEVSVLFLLALVGE